MRIGTKYTQEAVKAWRSKYPDAKFPYEGFKLYGDVALQDWITALDGARSGSSHLRGGAYINKGDRPARLEPLNSSGSSGGYNGV